MLVLGLFRVELRVRVECWVRNVRFLRFNTPRIFWTDLTLPEGKSQASHAAVMLDSSQREESS